MRKLTTIVAVLILAIGVLPFAAQAMSTVNLSWTPTTEDVFNRTLYGQSVYAERAGTVTTQIIGDDGQLLNGGEWFTGFCTQPGTHTGSGAVEIIDPSDIDGGLEAAWLYETYYQDGIGSIELAGLQVAVWEAYYDSTSAYNLSAGNFTIAGNNQSILDTAVSFLANVPGTFATGYLDSRYMIVHNEYKQDFITRTGVPEPSTVFLLGAGLAGVAAYGRKHFLS